MMKTRVQGTRVHHFCKAQLLYAAQTLHPRMVDGRKDSLRRNADKPMDRVVYDFFVHGDARAHS
jgi:hypothetical protein